MLNNLKNEVSKSFPDINFRRVENVGPKVSSELLKSGIIAISLSLAAMLFYIWIRFEWQFSLGAIIALFHDVINYSWNIFFFIFRDKFINYGCCINNCWLFNE